MWEHAFVLVGDPNHKGNLAETAITAAAVKLGIQVLRPMVEHGRYDLAFDLGDRLLRVQCKWAPRRGNVVAVNLAGFRYSSEGRVRSFYSESEIDAVAAYCEELDRCYLLPIELVAERRAVSLRLEPPKNGQRAALNWAADYELHGAIAQLGERLRGTQEVAGSSPASSTAAATTVGAHEYRNHFGWYMERAAAGESFLITRRGKPYARLSPPQEPLTATAEPKAKAAVEATAVGGEVLTLRVRAADLLSRAV
jgi:prevent-host-death family protein